jgi:CRISPR/Cas system CMR-associated protein Cmr5 small subunit
MKKNLEQIRGRNALDFANKHGEEIRGPQGGEVIKKLPSLILNHGLLATAAYSYTEKRGWQLTFDAIARHLAHREIAVLPAKVENRQQMMDWLTGDAASSEALKLATAETMAWLAYARRFVKKPAAATADS